LVAIHNTPSLLLDILFGLALSPKEAVCLSCNHAARPWIVPLIGYW
jgi:hypothetical protein